MNGYKNDTIIFKALCDEKRLSILKLLKGGEKCACVLMEELNIAQSALSYHMKILCESGIVTSRQEGKWTHYTISKSGREYAIKRLTELTS
ncbi:MAG: ArsR/SmtB family transcription factor [Coprococcus sp.]